MTCKFWIICLLGIAILPKKSSAQASSVDGTINTTKQTIKLATTTKGTTETVQGEWLPKVNATCVNTVLQLSTNPNCLNGKLLQTKKECQGTFKSPDGDRGCVIKKREINCTADQACSPWSDWEAKTNCCQKEECEFNGIPYKKGHLVRGRIRKCDQNFGNSCSETSSIIKCGLGRNGPVGGRGIDPPLGETTSTKSHSVRAIAVGLAGMVMVGLIIFAAVRIRKATLQKRIVREHHDRDIEGVDNGALAAMSSDSRVQDILNRMNSNGRHYELRERADSTPGRRVYVISPANGQGNHAGQRGRAFSRATSQLSSIAEESAEDALSNITEATEPLDDQRVFKYDSDTINGLENGQLDCAFEEDDQHTKPASSTEAINCITDVIAMYDIENEMENDLNEMLNRNSVISSHSDYRKSSEVKPDDYLSDFGWKPQERSWTIEKLKDEDTPKTNDRRLSISCSTLNSMYSSNVSIESGGAATDGEESHTQPLLGGDDDMTSSNLKDMKAFSSMPSVLDTSQIPDIEEMLSCDLQNGHCDVTDSGVVHA